MTFCLSTNNITNSFIFMSHTVINYYKVRVLHTLNVNLPNHFTIKKITSL